MTDNPILKNSTHQPEPVLVVTQPAEYRAVMQDIAGEAHETPQTKYAFVHVFVRNGSRVSQYVPSAATV